MMINSFYGYQYDNTVHFTVAIFLLCLSVFFLFVVWKQIEKQLIKHRRLKLLDERLYAQNNAHLNDKKSSKDVIEEIDPIEEAKILASYGKFEQAIKILKWQIEAYPKEIIPYSELFVIYIHLDDKKSYYLLLEAAPFEQNSAEYQTFLANAKMSFNENNIENLDNNIEEVSVDKKNVDVSLVQASNVTISNVAEVDKKSKKTSKINLLSHSKENISDKKEVSATVLQTSEKLCFYKLSSLEESIFFAFDGGGSFNKKLLLKKQEYQVEKKSDFQQHTFKNQGTQNKEVQRKKILIIEETLLIHKENLSVVNKVQKNKIHVSNTNEVSEEEMIKKFQEILLSKNESKAINYLEKNLRRNPLFEKLYPILIASYIELNLYKNYLSFRNEIFSNSIQPALDVILFMTDAESKFNIKQIEYQKVA